MKTCPKCGETKELSEFYDRGKTGNKIAWCKDCMKKAGRERMQDVKAKWLEYKGGARCSICGYDKYIGALEFHHVNPDEKEFSFSKMRSYNFERVKPELDKCIVVCSNCHKELHSEL